MRIERKMLAALLFIATLLSVSGQFYGAPIHTQVIVYEPVEQPYSPSWDSDLNRIHDDLDKKLRDMSFGDSVNVIAKGASIELLEAAAADYNCEVSSRYPAINAIALQIDKHLIDDFSKDVRIHHLEDADLEMKTFLDSSLDVTEIPEAYANYPYHGEGMVIAIVDTGIDNSHMDLDDDDPYNDHKVIAFRDVINGNDDFSLPIDAYDDQGHGTHCASIAAGTGEASSGQYRGVAYASQLVGVKVLSGEGSGTEQQILDGMQWVIDNKDVYGIDIVSMSLGSNSATPSDGTDSLCQMADAMMDAGLLLFVAAGNHGYPEWLYGYNTIGSPAASEKAVTIGSVNDDGSWSSFSNEGPTGDDRIKPDVMAVGADVTAAKADSTNQYVAYSGTSMATPTAAGIGALLRQANPSLNPSQLKDVLQDTAMDMGDPGKDNTYGSGIIQTKQALDVVTGGIDNPPTVSIEAPLDQSTVSDTYRILVAASDDNSVTSVELAIDGTWIDITANYDGTHYYYDWDTTTYSEGLHTISARATDDASQTAETTIEVTVSNEGPIDNPPTCVIADPTEGETITGTHRILVSASDDNGINAIEVRIDGGSWIDITGNFDGAYYYYDFDSTTVDDGTHGIEARAIDTISQATSDTISVTVENEIVQNAMFIADIEVSSWSFWIFTYCEVEVTIVAGTPSDYVGLSGATVNLETTSPLGSTKSYSDTTDSSGVAYFDIGWISSGTWVFKVIDVTHADYTYDPSLNINGDTVEVDL
ncbi:MAG: putative Subtilisin-like serine protease [Candidatus Thorarchaeota archaeon]|nr:MAG: putative Subtilisin-like serine protease [Candidatus Thorarchaeota archaeon]